jgi:hypothetical protein
MSLIEPARYTPWAKGVYEVAPMLKPFGTDFGNGEADRRVFQIDRDSPRYFENKKNALRERPEKYVGQMDLKPEVERAAADFIAGRLKIEYPGLYDFSGASLNELALQIAEDFVVISTEGGRDWVSFIHVCGPSHWAAEQKVGRSFFEVHTPIPAFDRVNSVASEMVTAMVRKGPFVRFVWGVESDDRLNHHPETPEGWKPEEWNGRIFSRGRFWVRTERQVIWGFPEVDAAIFTVRVGFVTDEAVLASPALRESLVAALNSMSPAARAYKGLDAEWDALMSLLK